MVENPTPGSSSGTRPRTRLRTIAFPVEHGGWGFLAEPVLLALLVAPSWPGVAIGVATAAAFLIRHPAKLFWRNRHRLELSPRYGLARRFAGLYALISAAGFVLAAAAVGRRPLLPFLILAPALAVYAAYDATNQARRLLPELAAPMRLAASAPAIALAAGWSWPAAGALWLILQLRAVPSILYVRARLRLERGERIDRRPSTWSHVVAVGAGGGLSAAGLIPSLAVGYLLILLVRAVRGLSPNRRPARAKQIGYSELALGFGYVATVAAGYLVGM